MKLFRLLFAVLMALFGFFTSAYAVPPDLTTLTAAVNVDAIGIALLAIAALILGFKTIKQGAMVVLRFIGWAK